MQTLHLLPGESRGEAADLVLNRSALERLFMLLRAANQDGYAEGRFYQRDGSYYTLIIEVIDHPPDHRAWKDVRLAYMLHNARRVRVDTSGWLYDADLLATHLYAARKAKRHTQFDAAAAIGISVGFIHKVEHCKSSPKPENFTRLCRYIGTEVGEYGLDP